MPSKKVLESKQQIVADLADKLRRAQSGVLVKYQGITVGDDTEMRKKLRTAGVEYVVMKNSLTKRACNMVGFDAMEEHMHGMNAIAISYEDPVTPAKILKEYADKIQTFEIRAGFLDGAVIDAATVVKLADIPSKETLLARLLGSLQSPISSLARALQAILDKDGSAGSDAPVAEAAAE